MTPQGEVVDQASAREFEGHESGLMLIAGRYEGIDERVRALVDQEISIGDYVLSGGELPAMVLIDAVSRLVPGVLGDQESLAGDSFTAGLLGHPQYTRPAEYRGLRVPEVLLSGTHREIEAGRRAQSQRRTLAREGSER